MKKLCLLMMVCLAGSFCMASDGMIAEWKFSGNSIHSADGRYKAVFRGSTQLSGEGAERCLVIGMSDKAEGIKLNKRWGRQEEFPELSPKGAFGLRATVRFRERTSKQPYMFIWDSKYVNYVSKDPNSQHGFCFYFSHWKGKLVPTAVIGFKDFSMAFGGKPVVLETDRKYVVAMEYDGVDTVTFKIDGKVNLVRKAKQKCGDMSPAFWGVSIGDRVAGTYNHFDGDIFDLALYKIDAAAKP